MYLMRADGLDDAFAELRVVLAEDVLGARVVPDGHGELAGDEFQVGQGLMRHVEFQIRRPIRFNILGSRRLVREPDDQTHRNRLPFQ